MGLTEVGERSRSIVRTVNNKDKEEEPSLFGSFSLGQEVNNERG
jgi:hypothetical protein